MHWMQSCIEKLTTGQIFYLPVSIQHIFFFFSSLHFSFEEMTERVINCWNPPSQATHTYSDTHKNSNSSFMFHVNSAVWESPISMTTGLRIRVKNCHSSAIVRAPWFRRALKSGGKEPRTGVEMEEFGSVGRIKGETEEWVMIPLKITLPPHRCKSPWMRG